MREIEFRGKTAGGFTKGTFVFGCLIKDQCGDFHIMPSYIKCGPDTWWDSLVDESIAVEPETIGQYIGLKDKAGHKIFEDDIVDVTNPVSRRIQTTIKSISSFWENVGIINKKLHSNCLNTEYTLLKMNIEVVGNVHDNPELLKAKS